MSNSYVVVTGDWTTVIGLRGKKACAASALSLTNNPPYGEIVEMPAKRANMFATSIQQDYMVSASVFDELPEAETFLRESLTL